jgi:hypothetical protein
MGGRGALRDDGGIPVARVQESSGEVARKLPRDDVVLVVCLAGAERRRSVGRDRAAAELELTGAVVRAAPVWKSEIGRVCEPQWVATVLLEH